MCEALTPRSNNSYDVIDESHHKEKPKKFISKVGLKSTQIYFAAENLITWTNLGIYKNSFDPEFDPNTQTTRRYPITRSFTGGLKASF